MPGLKLHTSNQLEKLARDLSAVLGSPAGSSLAQEVVVVQSRGMSRWVSIEVAKQAGICMNFEFPFPRVFVERTLRLFFPEMAPATEFSTGVLAWKIDALLPALVKRREFGLVRSYLEQEDELKRFQLSEKIARLFDQYLVYRPEMIMQWERGEAAEEWQATLWRMLMGKRPPIHIAAVSELLGSRMGGKPAKAIIAALPSRVSIFGISSLPPLYVRFFFELARHCDVNLFSLHPSQEYFGHDLPPKLRAKAAGRLARRGVEISDNDLPVGNPLLASMGVLNRDFIELQLEADERAGHVMQEEEGQFVEPGRDGMLSTVQGDILHARSRGDEDNPKVNVAAADRSIQVHACHSPMREVEVLYDQLLDLFNNDTSLRPRDVIVMAPDIEKYAPFIGAVFAFPEERGSYLPHSVTDRRPRSESPVVETFLALLALPGGRCTATEIFSLLAREPVRARYCFSDEDMALIRRWIVGTGIRWGIDAGHRAEFGVPEMDAHTWREGFRRLLLGFAMPGNDRAMWEGIMPYESVEGGDAETLGRFLAATDAIFEAAADLPRERTLVEWAETLGAIAGTFFRADTPQEAGDLRLIQKALDTVRDIATLTGDGRVAGFRAMRHYLSQLLDDTEQRGGFLTGGITFCALKPMRSIPARVICLIGMDDQAFPRQPATAGFDLMARDRRCGDRSSRDDDRYSFLEAIVSAREHLYVSYVGRSVVDNEEIPPSVAVSELMDYLDEAFLFPGRQSARRFLVRQHRLHAFSPQYFNGGDAGLFSYSEANAAASRELARGGQVLHPLFDRPLPEPDEEARDVDLATLVGFFQNPAKHLLRQRLGITLDEDEGALEDSEPFDLGNLERYHVKQELVAAVLDGHVPKTEEFGARGLLPHGGVGDAHFQRLHRMAKEFTRKLGPELHGSVAGEPLMPALKIGAFSLTGRIEPVYEGRVVHFRCARLKPKDWLRAWINHLARCAMPGEAREMVLAGEDETVRFSPVENPVAVELLATLLGLYWRGLVEPLPFFPKSAFAYADAVVHPSSRSKTPPLRKASVIWHGSEFQGSGEKRNTYMDFCFGGSDPIDDEFAGLAMEIFESALRNASSA